MAPATVKLLGYPTLSKSQKETSMAARRFIAQVQHIAAFMQKVHLGAVFLAHSLELDDKGARSGGICTCQRQMF
jgi:hypothetical protein